MILGDNMTKRAVLIFEVELVSANDGWGRIYIGAVGLYHNIRWRLQAVDFKDFLANYFTFENLQHRGLFIRELNWRVFMSI